MAHHGVTISSSGNRECPFRPRTTRPRTDSVSLDHAGSPRERLAALCAVNPAASCRSSRSRLRHTTRPSKNRSMRVALCPCEVLAAGGSTGSRGARDGAEGRLRFLPKNEKTEKSRREIPDLGSPRQRMVRLPYGQHPGTPGTDGRTNGMICSRGHRRCLIFFFGEFRFFGILSSFGGRSAAPGGVNGMPGI